MIHSDFILYLRKLVSGLQTFASQQEVDLSFESEVMHLRATYNPNEISTQLSKVLSLILIYTPQSFKVKVNFKKDDFHVDDCVVIIENTGLNLERISEIINATNYKTTVIGLGPNGTKFLVEIPLINIFRAEDEEKIEYSNKLNFSPYYLEIRKNLTSHFANIGVMEYVAMQNGHKDGFFLKKVNTNIELAMHDNNFKVDDLACKLSLSRTQLFRRIKALTKMPPGQYLLFYRLHTAKKLLLSENENLNVSEVCYRVGFMSKSHFSRSFQKQFGFNPSDCK